MTPNQKLELINTKIKTLNNTVLKEKKWKLGYINRGANNYCIILTENKKELFNGKFNTYDSVLSALELLEAMFSKALNDKGETV